MKQLNLFDDETLSATVTVPARSLTAAARKKLKRQTRTTYRRDRGTSSAMILELLWKTDSALRRSQIFHRMKREDTPFLRTLIEDMVHHGFVIKTTSRWPGGMDVFYYEANRAIERPEWSYL